MKRLAGYMLIFLVLVSAAGAGATWWYYRQALDVRERHFVELRDVLSPHLVFYLPDSPAPSPALVFIHGCGGVKDSMVPQVREAVSLGYVAVVLDSLTPRGISWRDTCDGRVLWGQERAADVLVAMTAAREHPAVDPDRLVVVGYSHGAWSVLEALTLGDELPPGLLDGPRDRWHGVRGIVTWYPYCGPVASFDGDWPDHLPVLMLLAAKDEITDPQPCAKIAAGQAAAGRPVREITFPGVSHAFDREEDWVVFYDAATARSAIKEQFSFIASLLD